jgi:DNA polymerase
MTVLSIDFETRSTVDLRSAGVYVYAQHHTTDVWCMAYAFDDEEPELWLPGEPVPERVREHVENGGEMRAWNAVFERLIWKYILSPWYGFPEPALGQWHDTAVEAAAMALPRTLEMCAEVMKVPQQKDPEGKRIMLQLCKPRRIENGKPVWWDDAKKFARLYEYCRQDVRTERALARCVRPLTAAEREIYLLDQRINDRGVLLDVPLITAAREISAQGIDRANADLSLITNGQVDRVTQVARLTSWMRANGAEVESLAKRKAQELKETELAPVVAQALDVRMEAARSSVAKLDSMLACLCPDNRARGLLQYHGANTGRWAGRLIQPQNFPRGDVKKPEWFLDLVRAGDYDELDLYAPPLAVVSSLLRGCIVASPGNRLVVADFSAIEARVLNWLAQQNDVVEMFRRGVDVYVEMAKRMEPGTSRQAGKAAELGCGYGMGAKKFVTAAWDVYGVRVTEEQSEHAVSTYRETHPQVVDYWKRNNDAALAAVRTPGTLQVVEHPVAPIKYKVAGPYLWLILPSGRPLCYAQPTIETREDPKTGLVWENQLRAWSMNQYTRQWSPRWLYGGLLVENIVQAVSRDLMATAMQRVEAAGYPVVLTVHDEVMSDVPARHGSLEEFERLMTTLPPWAAGCPVAVEGYEAERWRK